MRKIWLLAALIPCLFAVGLILRSRHPAAPVATVPLPARQAALEEPPVFAGTQACAECHAQRVDSFSKTAHALTSREADRKSISGPLDEGKNTLRTRNPRLWFEMQARAGGIYQDTMEATAEWYQRVDTERIDLVTGSGKKGETYLTWKDDRLYELPVSYGRLYGWIISPGYPNGVRTPPRPIQPPCLDCHATYFRVLSGGINRYARTGYVLGVGCERCHGPGVRHIEYQKAHPDEKRARYIVNPSELPVERQRDLCAQCHSDNGDSLRPAFSYRPGEPLAKYRRDKSETEQNRMGAHADNQGARLHLARCYQQSPAMTCITCHNPHVLERDQLAVFSKRCLDCHKRQACPMSKKLGASIEQNCIDCHMQLGQDQMNVSIGPNGPLMATQRDHFIGIFPKLTQRFLARGEHAK